MRFRHSFVLLLTPFAIAQTPATGSTATRTTIFSSDTLHLKYTYPSSFQLIPGLADDAVKTEKDKAQGAEKTVAACVSLPFSALEAASGMRMIVTLRLEAACLGKDISAAQVEDLVAGALSNSLGRFGTAEIGSTSPYIVAGHNAFTTSGTVTSQQYGMKFYGIASCFLQGKDAVCWELLTNDCKELPEMMSYPIQFEGVPAEALIPKQFTPSCK